MKIKKINCFTENFIKLLKRVICILCFVLIGLIVAISDCEVCMAGSCKGLVCERISPITCIDRYRDENGKLKKVHNFSDIENGDIFITDSVHTMGIKHGHTAIVVDAENQILLEAVTYGTPTKERKLERWTSYANVVHARISDEAAEEALEHFNIARDYAISPSQQLGNIAAQFAREKVGEVDYSIAYTGIKGKAPSVANLKKTQCAHLVWYIYEAFGVDIDASGGRLVTPKDIYSSAEVEIVESFGEEMFEKSMRESTGKVTASK